MNATNFSRTVAAIQHGIDQRDHLGAQLCIWHGGEPILDLAIGEKRLGVALASDDLLPWMSAGKPLTAVAIAQLVEQQKISFDDRVAQRIPAFAAGGKENITLRHVLTHTGGFRLISNNWTPEPWDRVIERICASKIEPDWIPGARAGYHVASGWFILGEIIQRVTGRPFDQYIKSELLEPLGMHDSWIGMPAERFDAYGGFDGRIAPMYGTEKQPMTVKGMVNSAAGCTLFRPGANARGPIRELARFYQMLLNGGLLDGHRVLSEAMVRSMISRQRVGMMDQTFKRVIDWGMGFIINSRHYEHDSGEDSLPYGFGPYASDDAFGHGGNQSSCGMADPKRELVLTWVCNGMPGEARHDARVRAINAAVFEDLRLT